MPEAWERYSGSDEDPSLRTKRAIGRFIAEKKPAKKKKNERKTIYRDDDGKPVSFEAIEAMDRIQAANEREAEGLELSPPRAKPRGAEGRVSSQRPIPPSIKESINQRIRQKGEGADDRSTGALGPQRISPPLNRAAIELNREQAEARLAESAEAGAEPPEAAGLPIEGGRVFLELEKQEPFVTEGEREMERQRKMLEVQRSFVAPPEALTDEEARALKDPFAGETPEWKRQVQKQIGNKLPEEKIPDLSYFGVPIASELIRGQMRVNAAERASPELARKQISAQFRTQAALESAKAKTRAAGAEAATGRDLSMITSGVVKMQKTYVTLRLFIQAITFESVVSLFTFFLDMNLLTIKQYLAPRLDFKPLYPKTEKPSISLTVATGCLDFMVVIFFFASIVIPIALVLTVVFAAVKFDVFKIVSDYFSSLF